MEAEYSFIKDIFDDPKFTHVTIEIIKQVILQGFTPEEAAAQAGIARTRFNKWRSISKEFDDFIEMLVLQMSGRYKTVIDKAMTKAEEVDDYKEAANIAMKNLERLNPEYGTKRLDIKESKKDLVRPEDDEVYKDVIKKAEEAANVKPEKGEGE